MTFEEILAADIANYERQHGQAVPEAPQDESVKTNVDFRRNIQLGQMLVEHFPELECFRPQLHAAANAAEFQLFEDFLIEISKNRTFQSALKKMIKAKLAEQKKSEAEVKCKSAPLGSTGNEQCIT